jgi:hypothetical protein
MANNILLRIDLRKPDNPQGNDVPLFTVPWGDLVCRTVIRSPRK